ncbi:transporter [Luteolibacter sp. AS25]|uniref:transporter n=1 Tax=Luteolibacter sp. AS25 TaxID=3135776 RepID=UPI00398BA6C9
MKQMTGMAVMLAGISTVGAQTESLRPLSTDRPDATESPYTVDAGHYQFELEIGAVTKDGGDRSYSLGELNAKYGLDTATDVQFVLPHYNHIEGGAEGFGDMQIRVKRNLWGNDEDGTALAVMPFIQLPTGADGISSEELEGGIIVPFGFEGAGGWGYGFQAELDVVADEDGSGHHFSFLTSATAAHDLTETVGIFFEVVAIFSEGSEALSEYYFNSGLTVGVTDTLQFDGGVRVGLSNDSEDFTPFVGVSAKF